MVTFIRVATSLLMTIFAYFTNLNKTKDVEIEIIHTKPIALKIIDDIKGELMSFYSDNEEIGKERFRFILGEPIRIEKIDFSG